MATFANLSDVISTTIQSRSASLADSVTKNNALLMKMRERGNVKPFGGGSTILMMRRSGSYQRIDLPANSWRRPVPDAIALVPRV